MAGLFASDPIFRNALPLAERAALPGMPQAWDDALAAQRLQRWRRQVSDGALARRLASLGLEETAFQHLLGETPESLAARAAPPPWLLDLDAAFTDPVPLSALPAAAKERSDFLPAVTPLIAWACAELRHGARDLAAHGDGDLPFDPETVPELFFESLVFPLNLLLGRTLSVEIHIAAQQGRLTGETPEERFTRFMAGIGAPAACRELLRTYPVLARQLSLTLRQWIGFVLEVLGNLLADRETLCSLFHRPDGLGRLAAAGGGAGDRHRDGHAVVLLRFDSGLRLLYKPKPLGADLHFQELLEGMNAWGWEPPLRPLRVLDRGTYGWQEFAAAAACATAAEVERFYTRTGGLLALLYILEATDVHLDNLIAAGEHPMLVDLESLFHARAEGLDPSIDPAQRALGHSVLRPGLLPQRTGAGLAADGNDISALGGAAGQQSATPLPAWESLGTDAVRLVRRRVELPAGENRPRLGDAEVDVRDHAGAFLGGFTAACRLLIARRGELLAPGGPLDRFAGDTVRALLRPTMSYMRLLQESCHPHVLQSALERDRLFDKLWETASADPKVDPAIAAEHADLWQGDVPVFTTRPDSRDLWDSRGRRLPDFSDQPALESVRRRLLALDEADIARQSWFIRASLATLALNTEGNRLPSYEVRDPRTPARRESLLAAAREVGERLESLAVRDARAPGVSWIGLSILGDYWALLPLGPDLYSGLTGIALFLAHLGAATGEPRFTALAAEALDSARRQLTGGASALPIVGAFSGWGGVIYALVHLAALWDDPSLLTEAEEVAAGPLGDLGEGDSGWDLMMGAAGAVASLLLLHARRPAERTLATAILYGERLLAAAVPQPEGGIAWPPPGIHERPLSGFSHGAAGIAWALASLATATGEHRFRDAAVEALRYERALFSPAAGNWRDLRDIVRMPDAPPGAEYFMTAWCHGAPGIGLGRLLTRPHLDDPLFAAEIEAAIANTLAEGFGLGHCLCHGDLGNLETLLLAGPRQAADVERLSAVILESIKRDGWLCGVPGGVETPGLMVGLAGIGYGLLRLADPERVPSVLALEPPRTGEETRT
jgi:type 2 lantibiotic biosynthesis protein LanM